MALLTLRLDGRRPVGRRQSRSGLVALALIVWAQMLNAQPTTTRSPEQAIEAEVKAVFLYNFAKYIDWPAASQGSSATIRMCVTAHPQFLAVLRQAVRDEIINGRPLAAIGLDGLDGARGCDILYLGDSATPDAAAWINAARGRQILTVGDGRLVDGLVIAFVRDQDRVRFDINRQAAAKQGLAISSRLLGLARRVEP